MPRGGPSSPIAGPGAPAPEAPAPSYGRSLREVSARATAIVLAHVARIDTEDDGALRVYRVRAVRVLHGRVDEPEIAVAEVRGASQRPSLLEEGEQAILVLEPADGQSYLRERLPDTRPMAIAGGRSGILRIGTDGEVDAVARALADGAAIAGLPAEARPAAIRRLAFAELASGSPRLATDALIELQDVSPLEPLAPDELAALRATLAAPRVDAVTRAGLVELLGRRTVRSALPAVRAALVDGPAVLDAVLAARASLGDPPGPASLEPYLRASDAGVRAAAVRALARAGDPAVIPELARYATGGDDPQVREAAIDALGRTNRPEAARILGRTFESDDRATTQASGRALMALDDPAAADVLADLALRARTPQLQKYAAVLLIASRGRDHPAVRRVEAGHPSAEVRDVLEHGLEFLHSHEHD